MRNGDNYMLGKIAAKYKVEAGRDDLRLGALTVPKDQGSIPGAGRSGSQRSITVNPGHLTELSGEPMN